MLIRSIENGRGSLLLPAAKDRLCIHKNSIGAHREGRCYGINGSFCKEGQGTDHLSLALLMMRSSRFRIFRYSQMMVKARPKEAIHS